LDTLNYQTGLYAVFFATGHATVYCKQPWTIYYIYTVKSTLVKRHCLL